LDKIGERTQRIMIIYIEEYEDKIINEGVAKSVYLEPGSLILQIVVLA